MWLFTPMGYYSVVQDAEHKNVLVVRSRVKSDLKTLKTKYLPTLSKIFALKDRDYQFRAFISKQDYAKGLAAIAMDIDYTNFKDTVKIRQSKKRADLYEEIWVKLLELDESWNSGWADYFDKKYGAVKVFQYERDDYYQPSRAVILPHGERSKA